jgi:beta-phosphoglucomutase
VGNFAILWDLDGVIADTAEAHFLAWSTFTKRHHIPYSRAIFQKTFGMNNQSILTLLFQKTLLKLNFDDLAQEKETIFNNSLEENVHLFPCAVELMIFFQSEGLLQIIASSAPEQNIRRIVSYLCIDHLVPDFVSGDHLSGKPHPAVFQRAAEFLDVTNEACLVIEDSPLGIQAAQAAMMYCVGVASTFKANKLSSADDVVMNLCSLQEKIHNRGFNKYICDISIDHQKTTTTILPN